MTTAQRAALCRGPVLDDEGLLLQLVDALLRLVEHGRQRWVELLGDLLVDVSAVLSKFVEGFMERDVRLLDDFSEAALRQPDAAVEIPLVREDGVVRGFHLFREIIQSIVLLLFESAVQPVEGLPQRFQLRCAPGDLPLDREELPKMLEGCFPCLFGVAAVALAHDGLDVVEQRLD